MVLIVVGWCCVWLFVVVWCWLVMVGVDVVKFVVRCGLAVCCYLLSDVCCLLVVWVCPCCVLLLVSWLLCVVFCPLLVVCMLTRVRLVFARCLFGVGLLIVA